MNAAYKKSELTQFAKECARVSDHIFQEMIEKIVGCCDENNWFE